MAVPPAPIQTVTGSGIVDQATTKEHDYAQDLQAQQNAAALQAQNLRQYYLEAQRNGIQAAQLAYQQRSTQITATLQARQDAYTQRQGQASLNTQIANMLAAKNGPQDWVKFNNLENGLNAPNPQKSTTVDPYSWTANLVDPSYRNGANIDTSMGDLSGMMQPGTPPSLTAPMPFQQPPPPSATQPTQPSGSQQPAPYSAPAITAPGAPPVGSPQNPTIAHGVGSPSYSGIPNEQVAGLTSGQSALRTTGSLGPSYGSDYSGYTVANPATGHPYGATDQIPGGTPVWLTRLARGGYGIAGGGMPMQQQGPPPMSSMMMLGDAPGANPNAGGAKPELMSVPPGTPVQVLNHQQTQKAMGKGAKGKGGHSRRRGAKPVRAASGGVYNAGDPNTLTYNQYDPATLGSQPFYQKLTGQMQSRQFGGFGAQLSNPAYGISNAPWAINLQAYNSLDPTEQQQTQGLYEDALGTSWADQLAQAQRASPAGYSMNATRYG